MLPKVPSPQAPTLQPVPVKYVSVPTFISYLPTVLEPPLPVSPEAAVTVTPLVFLASIVKVLVSITDAI